MKETIIGSRIKAERTRAKMNRYQLGKLAGYSPETIRFWESGYTIPRSPAIIDLCDVLGCTADYLLGRTDDREG